MAITFRLPADCADTNGTLTFWSDPEIVLEFACANFTRPVDTALTALSQQAAQAVHAARGAAQNAERPAPSISRASQ